MDKRSVNEKTEGFEFIRLPIRIKRSVNEKTEGFEFIRLQLRINP